MLEGSCVCTQKPGTARSLPPGQCVPHTGDAAALQPRAAESSARSTRGCSSLPLLSPAAGPCWGKEGKFSLCSRHKSQDSTSLLQRLSSPAEPAQRAAIRGSLDKAEVMQQAERSSWFLSLLRPRKAALIHLQQGLYLVLSLPLRAAVLRGVTQYPTGQNQARWGSCSMEPV